MKEKPREPQIEPYLRDKNGVVIGDVQGRNDQEKQPSVIKPAHQRTRQITIGNYEETQSWKDISVENKLPLLRAKAEILSYFKKDYASSYIARWIKRFIRTYLNRLSQQIKPSRIITKMNRKNWMEKTIPSLRESRPQR